MVEGLRRVQNDRERARGAWKNKDEAFSRRGGRRERAV